MKIAPVIRALSEAGGVEQRLVHTGQHYDDRMARIFFDELGLPRPDHDLGVGSGSQAEQTAAAMVRLEKLVEKERPDTVVVVGDVNSTVAAALVAAKAGIPLAHVEAGLRSFDLSMPEEINRLVTDRLSALLFTPSRDADENLRREGVPIDRIHRVGNVMIDTLLRHRPVAPWERLRDSIGFAARGYAVLTLHRPANVDDPGRLARLFDTLRVIGERYPIVFPVHPRTAQRLAADEDLRRRAAFLRQKEPLGYLDFLALMDHAALVLTDSGGIQEETTVLGVPCFTLRDNTERPVTVEEGTNTLVGAEGGGLEEAFREFLAGGGKKGRIPELWDGRSGERIADVLRQVLGC
jgi:UDP-N-acetylglucosamine 2-epimerase (non-hydrolysing)